MNTVVYDNEGIHLKIGKVEVYREVDKESGKFEAGMRIHCIVYGSIALSMDPLHSVGIH